MTGLLIVAATALALIAILTVMSRRWSERDPIWRSAWLAFGIAVVAVLIAVITAFWFDYRDLDSHATPQPSPTTGAAPTGAATSPPAATEPNVQYRGIKTLKPGQVLVLGRDRAAVRQAPTSGFEIWWDVQLSAKDGHLQVLGENLLVESGPRPSWKTCQDGAGGPEVLDVDARKSVFCLDLRFAGTATIIATPRSGGAVKLDYKVWER